jgi:hypothetical protein
MTAQPLPLPRQSRVYIEEGLAVISTEHEIMACLAQEVLDPFWQVFPGFPMPVPLARALARQALTLWNEQVVDAAPEELFEQALTAASPDLRPYWQAFLRRMVWRDQSKAFENWRDFFSANQHEQFADPGLNPATVDHLLRRYRAEVVGSSRATEALLEQLAALTGLSDWDLWISTHYALSLAARGRFDPGLQRMILTRLYTRDSFEAFLRAEVLILPPDDQRALCQLVRAYWADLSSEPVEGLAAALQAATPTEADDIPCAAEMLA